MKQNITEEQYLELNETQKENLLSWNKDRGYLLKNLSVGQMIEYLYQKQTIYIVSEEKESPNFGFYVRNATHDEASVELADALWKVVKDYLRK